MCLGIRVLHLSLLLAVHVFGVLSAFGVFSGFLMRHCEGRDAVRFFWCVFCQSVSPSFGFFLQFVSL